MSRVRLDVDQLLVQGLCSRIQKDKSKNGAIFVKEMNNEQGRFKRDYDLVYIVQLTQKNIPFLLHQTNHVLKNMREKNTLQNEAKFKLLKLIWTFGLG